MTCELLPVVMNVPGIIMIHTYIVRMCVLVHVCTLAAAAAVVVVAAAGMNCMSTYARTDMHACTYVRTYVCLSV